MYVQFPSHSQRALYSAWELSTASHEFSWRLDVFPIDAASVARPMIYPHFNQLNHNIVSLSAIFHLHHGSRVLFVRYIFQLLFLVLLVELMTYLPKARTTWRILNRIMLTTLSTLTDQQVKKQEMELLQQLWPAEFRYSLKCRQQKSCFKWTALVLD